MRYDFAAMVSRWRRREQRIRFEDKYTSAHGIDALGRWYYNIIYDGGDGDDDGCDREVDWLGWRIWHVMGVDDERTRVFGWVARLRELNNTLAPHTHVWDHFLTVQRTRKSKDDVHGGESIFFRGSLKIDT